MYQPESGEMKPITEEKADELLKAGTKGIFRVGEVYECNSAKMKCLSIMANELRFKTILK